jgi:hypothetical protein
MAETLLLGKELSTTSGGGVFLALGSSASFSLLDLLQRGTLRHFNVILCPRGDRSGCRINWGLGPRLRVSNQGFSHVLAVALSSGSGQRRRRGRRGEGVRHSAIGLNSPDIFRDSLSMLVLLLLLTLGRSSLVDLLRQSESRLINRLIS